MSMQLHHEVLNVTRSFALAEKSFLVSKWPPVAMCANTGQVKR